ncbi:hypothetical protein [Amycolatopsis saalfeldensis]|uniref:Uncharacterized protein n=1 Tax=Amycolatopsis saalfeldensis TaxID=394193 RepID=A0A1H8W145_9PSEU|nr:hypothetical protein [Amycolatopsis saalfeldensis]SEP21325.1 hypothetical protein SAMN04489732_104461 [Amycolatopsis saalfeldensis]
MNMPPGFEEDFQYLMEYASEDWVGMAPLSATASAMAGKHPTLEQEISSLLKLVSELMDHGALPGDLIKDYPDFVPWVGTKAEILERIERETRALGDMPVSGEVAWFHVVDENLRV